MRISTRPLLSFPAGRAFGLNPNHPAGRPVAHWVAGQPCTPTSDCFQNQRGVIGPTWTLPTDASGATNKILVNTQNNSTTVTFAAIISNHIFKTGRVWCANEAGNRGLGLTNNNFCCYSNLSNLLQCGPSDTDNGAPVFAAYSYSDNGPWYAVRRDLATGKLYTASGTLGVGAVATDNTFGVTFIGQLWNGNEHARFDIAAFSKTLKQMNPTELDYWARDPWSFWYPRQIQPIEIVGSAIASKTLAADAGSYTIIGTAASLLLKRNLAAAAGSYALTGTNAALNVGKKVAAGAGAYNVTGATAALLHGWKVAAAAGSYTITGATASLLHKWLIAATAGAYNINGTDVGLIKPGNKLLAAGAGAYAITGSVASLLHKWIIPASAGSYAINGQTANLKHGWSVTVTPGAYTVNGQPVTLRRNLPLLAGAGSYAINGQTASLRQLRKLIASSGMYLVTGTDVNLQHGLFNFVPDKRIAYSLKRIDPVESLAGSRIVNSEEGD